MEKEELDKFIAKMESEVPKEKAFFGVNMIDHEENAYISANKYGLELFAIELLKAAKKATEIKEDSEKNIIIFDPKEKWITGNIRIGYIEPKLNDRIDLKIETYKETWKDSVAKYGCFTIIAILIIIFIAGIFKVISWF
ncbi:hypothetical protein [Flavobacterium sp.]|uniref:hypothetical protein n=1 Tax=Flavobacterium sp. TaxID=239 RepID=UPI00391D95A6